MSAAIATQLPLLTNLWRVGLIALLVVILGLDLAEPSVIKRLVKRYALLGLLVQEAEDKVLALLGVVGPLGGVKDYSILTSHPDCLLLGVVVERQRAAEQRVHDAAEGPQIAGEGVGLLLEDLWRYVAQRAERLSGAFVGTNHFGKAEIDQFGHRLISCVGHHNIFKFQITMDDAIAVKILDSEGQLISELFDAVLTQIEISDLQVIEQIGARHVIEHDVIVLTVLEKIDQVDNVRVLAHLEHFDFTPLLEDLNMGHVLLLDLLDGDLLRRLLVQCELDEAELALSERLVERVVLEHVRVAHGLLQPVFPLLLVLELREEDQTRFIWRDNQLDRVEILASLPLLLSALVLLHRALSGLLAGGVLGGDACSIFRTIGRAATLLGDFVHSDIFEISSSQAVHNFMISVTLFSEKAQLVSLEHHPVLFVALCLCF